MTVEHPILHLNETEALTASSTSSTAEAARWLFSKTGNSVLITLGDRGCYFFDGNAEETIAPVPVVPVDTIGAGDSHIGAVMACLKQGDSLSEAVQKANLVSSRVVGTSGALLPDEAFEKLGLV